MNLQLTGWWLLRSPRWSCSGPRPPGLAVFYLPPAGPSLKDSPEKGGSASRTQKPSSFPLPGPASLALSRPLSHGKPGTPACRFRPLPTHRALTCLHHLKLRGLPGRTAGAADGCAPNPPCARRSALQGSQSQALDLPRPPPDSPGAGGVLSAAGTCLAVTLLPDHEAWEFVAVFLKFHPSPEFSSQLPLHKKPPL